MVVRFVTDGRAIVEYSVVLRYVETSGLRRTVRVFDNAHGSDDPQGEHHMHRYSLDGDKQPPEIFHHGTPAEAFRDARQRIFDGFEEMIAPWRR